jgi:hypothetical protein
MSSLDKAQALATLEKLQMKFEQKERQARDIAQKIAELTHNAQEVIA